MGKKKNFIAGAAAGIKKNLIASAFAGMMLAGCQMPANYATQKPIEQPEEEPQITIECGEPCDKQINGYILHDFLGENTVFPENNNITKYAIRDTTNYYLGLAKNWFLDQLKQIQDLNKGSEKPEYFDTIYKNIKDIDFHIAGGYQLEKLTEAICNQFKPVLQQIYINLPADGHDRHVFEFFTYFLLNEGLKYGAGYLRNTDCPTMKEYRKKMDSNILNIAKGDYLAELGINFDDGFDDNDLYAMTQKQDQIFETVGEKLGVNKIALQRCYNLAVNSSTPFDAMNNRTVTDWPKVSATAGYNRFFNMFEDLRFKLRLGFPIPAYPPISQENRNVIKDYTK